MCGNRGRDEIFGVECRATLHCDWPILTVRKIGGTELVMEGYGVIVDIYSCLRRLIS